MRTSVLAAVALLVLCAPAGPATAKNLTFAVQGRLSSSGGNPVDGKYGVAVSIYDAIDAPKPVYQELFIGVPVTAGLFSLTLGTKDQQPLDAAALAQKVRYFGLSIDADAELARQPVSHTPLAFEAERAFDVQCSGCVTAGDIADGAVGAAQIATGAVGADKVGFTYAGSTAKGGAAFDLDCAGCVASGELAAGAVGADQLGVNFAGSQSKGGAADKALALACTGCVAKTMLAADVLQPYATLASLDKVATSGSYKDLKDQPNLALYGALGGDNGWSGANTLTGETTVNGVNFNKTEAKLFRFQNAASHPSTCDGTVVGLSYYNTTDSALYVCNGKDFFPFATVIPLGSDANPAKSCKAILDAKVAKGDGLYWLDPDGASGSNAKFQTWCDMTTDGGGWTTIGQATSQSTGADVQMFNSQDRGTMSASLSTGTYRIGWQKVLGGYSGNVEVQYYCYKTDLSYTFWARLQNVGATAISNEVAAGPTYPGGGDHDFLLQDYPFANKAGQTSTTGKLASFHTGNGSGGEASCGNSHAGQGGIKTDCGQAGQSTMNPKSVWLLLDANYGAPYVTPLNSCGDFGGSTLSGFAVQVRIRY